VIFEPPEWLVTIEQAVKDADAVALVKEPLDKKRTDITGTAHY
jgi:hypothetical protein